MASSKKVEYFDGKGDVNSFLVKARLYNKLKKYEGEAAAVSLASRLQEPAFNVYLRMSDEDKKDVEKIEAELKKQYQVGNRDREEALYLLSAVHRKEDPLPPTPTHKNPFPVTIRFSYLKQHKYN